MKALIHVLTGCTAVGKTEVALRWAEEHNAEIISCDSLLFYRHMDIGTAKPTTVELARVPHHLIDVVASTEAMDITRYITLVRAALEAIAARWAGLDLAGVSLVTNPGAGYSGEPLSHAEVLAAGREAGPRLAAVIRRFVRELPTQ